MSKSYVITCPFCDYEYLPAEIYFPKPFFGNPGQIMRNYAGKILEYTGTNLNPRESYICDNCGQEFKVSAYIKFITHQKKQNTFEEEYSTPLNDESLTLEETKK